MGGETRVALVTGSSSGIGLEIVRGLAVHGITTILSARSVDKGQEAAKVLQQQQEGLVNKVLVHQLDVTSSESVDALAAWIRETFGRLDILVNNAGLGGDPGMMETNYYGAKRVTKAMLPLMKQGSRIINVSSVAGRLDILCHEEWRAQLEDVDKLNEQIVDSFVEDYLANGHKRKFTLQIPRVEGYTVSKIALSSYSRVCAKEVSSLGILVLCMCPGLTSTKMTANNGHPASLGAETAIWLATLPSPQVSNGGFYVNKQEVGYVHIPFFVSGKMLPGLAEFVEVLASFEDSVEDR